jgi:ribulose-5-phosphate 4-epimerase/fuculose-1-phosphate aldolase
VIRSTSLLLDNVSTITSSTSPASACGYTEEKSNAMAERLPDMPNPDPSRYSEDEWRTRVDLAAAYRLIAALNMDDAIFTHISARIPGTEVPTFLINPYGMMFEEVTASSLVKIDVQGRKICDSPWPVNPAGFDIHSAVHMRSPNAHCVIHTHSLAGMTVASMPEGLLPLNQMSLHFYQRIGRYSYDTIHFPPFEKDRLVASIADHPALIMESHGMMTCGPTVADAFFYMYYLEKACRIQVQVMAGTRAPIPIKPEVAEEGRILFEDRHEQKRFMWAAFVRKLHRDSPDFAT